MTEEIEIRRVQGYAGERSLPIVLPKKFFPKSWEFRKGIFESTPRRRKNSSTKGGCVGEA